MEESSNVQKSQSDVVSLSNDNSTNESSDNGRSGNDVRVYADGLQILANTAEEQLTTCTYVYNQGSNADNQEQQNGIFLVVESADPDGEQPPKIVHVDSNAMQAKNGKTYINYGHHFLGCSLEKDSSGITESAAGCPPFFQCFKCEQLFNTQKDCERHIEKYHRTCQISFAQHICPICTTVMSLDAFLEHADAFHFRCKLCPLTEPAVFDCQKKLELHTLRIHKTECYICHQKILRQSLSDHMAMEHPLTCTLCYGLEMFENELDLNNHLLRVHHSVCAFCRKYVLKKDLASHIANQHHRCDVCYKTFDTTADLHQHAAEHHGTMMVAPVQHQHAARKTALGEPEILRIAFYCTVCYMDFPTKGQLDTHKTAEH